MKADLYHRKNKLVPLDLPVSFANLKKVATVEGAPPVTAEELLDRAFTLTQDIDGSWATAPAPGVTPEPSQAGGTRSTLVGDVIEIDGAWWVRSLMGWESCNEPGPVIVDRTAEFIGKGVAIGGAKPACEKK